MKKALALTNFIVIIAVVFWNYWTAANGLNGNKVGELSAEYNNLFTPASYAFSIWGIIFLALIAGGIFLVRRAWSDKENDFILQMGPWLIGANLANMAWTYFWLMELTLTSVFIMLTILFCLTIATIRLNMARWDAPFLTIAFVWWPLMIYYGWIAVATIANVASYLAKMDWTGGLSEVTWTAIMITVAILLNLFMIWSRNMREFSLVGVWALIAIAIRHWDSIPLLQWLCVGGVIVLFGAASWHAYLNRDLSILVKWRQYKQHR